MSTSASEPVCVDCAPSTSSAEPTPASAAPSAPADLLNSNLFVPPNFTVGHDAEELPRIVIEFCDRCRWLTRAIWVQTELFHTFSPASATGLKAISLVPRTSPETGGRFRVWLYRSRSIEQEFEESAGKESWDGAELVWDRKIEGGFPELKELKQRIRALIAPEQDLGHSDKPGGKKPVPESKKEETAEESQADDYTPRFRC